MIYASIFDDSIAAFGSFIVRDGYRKQGIGSLLWETAMKHVGGRNVSLYATNVGVPFYKKRGLADVFETDTPMEVISYRCCLQKSLLPRVKDVSGITICDLSADMLTDLVTYDAGIHSVRREGFLKHWLKPEVTKTMVALENGIIVGYAASQLSIFKRYDGTPLVVFKMLFTYTHSK